MRQIVYWGQATEGVSHEELVLSVTDTRRNNEVAGLSEMVSYSGAYGLQALEGESAALYRTDGFVVADPRHTVLGLLVDGGVQRLLFPDWTMEFCYVDDQLADELGGSTPAIVNPLASPDLIPNAGSREPCSPVTP